MHAASWSWLSCCRYPNAFSEVSILFIFLLLSGNLCTIEYLFIVLIALKFMPNQDSWTGAGD
jgi:hypothetical protein